MKILKKKKKKKIIFFLDWDFFFFFKLGKKSPKSHWERYRISAPEDTKKNPWVIYNLSKLMLWVLKTHVQAKQLDSNHSFIQFCLSEPVSF